MVFYNKKKQEIVYKDFVMSGMPAVQSLACTDHGNTHVS